ASRAKLVSHLRNKALLWFSATSDRESSVRARALWEIVARQGNALQTWHLVRESVINDKHSDVRIRALDLLANGQKDDPQTWQLVRESATNDESDDVCFLALNLLIRGQKDDPQTLQLVRESALSDNDVVRRRVSQVIAQQAFLTWNVRSLLSRDFDRV